MAWSYYFYGHHSPPQSFSTNQQFVQYTIPEHQYKILDEQQYLIIFRFVDLPLTWSSSKPDSLISVCPVTNSSNDLPEVSMFTISSMSCVSSLPVLGFRTGESGVATINTRNHNIDRKSMPGVKDDNNISKLSSGYKCKSEMSSSWPSRGSRCFECTESLYHVKLKSRYIFWPYMGKR